MSEINGIPVVKDAYVEDKGYTVPFITSIDGDLFLLQTIRNRGNDGYEPYYVRIGSVLKEYLNVRNRKEPTQEEIENNVSPYQRGYVDGYSAGRKNGNTEGRVDATDEAYAKGEKDGYQKGLEDAWNCARMIVMQEDDGGLSYEVLEKIFGARWFAHIFKRNEASDAIRKIKKYKSDNAPDDPFWLGCAIKKGEENV